MGAKGETSGKTRERLSKLQRVVQERTEMQKQLALLDKKRKAIKARIRELDAALAIESVDAGGESVITVGESGADVVGKIGGR